MMEDLPRLAIRRAELQRDCFDIFVRANEALGTMRGVSKTSVLCRREGMRIGLKRIFSRFCWTQKLRDTLYLNSNEEELDPFFASCASEDSAILEELMNGGRTLEEAQHVFSIVSERLVESAKTMHRLSSTLKASASTSEEVTLEIKSEIAIDSDEDDNLCDIAVQDNTYSIRLGHLRKLLRLYSTYTQASCDMMDPTFLRRVFCVLSRIELLSADSVGYQMALPESKFGVLSSLLGVNTECFASPLNVTLERYFSVAPDTDQFFGAKGNFFASNLGQYEFPLSLQANPPFVEEIMVNMAQKIESFLEDGESQDAALSFSVFIPAWHQDDDYKAYQILKTSRFQRRIVRLLEEKHSWCPGMQHRMKHSLHHIFFPSKQKSLLVVLQTSQAAKKWPLGDLPMGEIFNSH